jgi:hypothetical protein
MTDKIFIGTPCYGGMITADYFKSVLQLTALAATKKIELQFGTIGNESLITRARNTLVQLFMDESQYTHLLFIDADIAFNEVLDGATGFMLIKRNVFKKMALAYPELKFIPDQHIGAPHDKTFSYHDTSKWNYTFFDTMIEPDTKRYLSEDYAFCRLWQKIGGKIYADIISGMTHMGNYSFKGNVATQFTPQKKK